MPERCPHCDAELPPTDDAFCPQCRESLEVECELAPEPPQVVHSIKETSGRKPANNQTIDLVTMATFPNPQEASIARGALADAGVAGYLVGAETVNTLWYVGTALGGVKLQVARRDVDRATEILGDVHSLDDSETVAPWKCPSCGVEVDAGFEICWSCGSTDDGQPADAAIEQRGDVARTSISVGTTDGTETLDEVASSDAEETAMRAWRCAIFGIGFSPLLVYSLFLILTLMGQNLSPAGTRRFYGALAVIIAMFGLFWSIFHALSIVYHV